MSGANKREVAKAEKSAELIVQSLKSAGEAAVATTLAGITDVLKGNPPLMYHISALLHNPEWRGVLMASAMGGDQGSAEPTDPTGAKPAKVTKLRTNIKKFEQLTRRSPPLFKKKRPLSRL